MRKRRKLGWTSRRIHSIPIGIMHIWAAIPLVHIPGSKWTEPLSRLCCPRQFRPNGQRVSLTMADETSTNSISQSDGNEQFSVLHPSPTFQHNTSPRSLASGNSNPCRQPDENLVPDPIDIKSVKKSSTRQLVRFTRLGRR
jgi:hypothetical protein